MRKKPESSRKIKNCIPNKNNVNSIKSPYNYQDNNQEKVIHSGWEKGNSYRFVLEGTGDIFREISTTKCSSYIDEKIRRIEKQFEDVKSGIHQDDSYEYSYENNKENFKKMISQWKNQPVENDIQNTARNLNISMLNNNIKESKKNIKIIKKFIEKEN